MRELERQQKEAEENADRVYDMNTGRDTKFFFKKVKKSQTFFKKIFNSFFTNCFIIYMKRYNCNIKICFCLEKKKITCLIRNLFNSALVLSCTWRCLPSVFYCQVSTTVELWMFKSKQIMLFIWSLLNKINQTFWMARIRN